MAFGQSLTDPETGPSCDEVPFAVKATPLGAFSLTSSAAKRVRNLIGKAVQLSQHTRCGVVKVLVDKLPG